MSLRLGLCIGCLVVATAQTLKVQTAKDVFDELRAATAAEVSLELVSPPGRCVNSPVGEHFDLSSILG
jgi:hypothetical protein